MGEGSETVPCVNGQSCSKRHISHWMPGPVLFWCLGYEADRTYLGLLAGQLEAKGFDQRVSAASGVAVGQRDVRSPGFAVQHTVAPGGKARSLLRRPEDRVKGFSWSGVEHDGARVVEDPAQCDGHWWGVSQESPCVVGHGGHLVWSDLVGKPGDERSHVQPFPRNQVQPSESCEPLLP